MKRMNWFSLSFLAIALFLSVSATPAQQTEQRKPRVPRLTTEDIVRSSSGQTTETKPVEAGTNKAGAEVKSSASAGGSVKKEGETKPSAATAADEAAWRERVAQARQRAETLERQAEEAEIRTTELRNQLNQSGQGANERNTLAADMDRTGKQVTELRAQAREAKAELGKLVEEGAEKGYREASGPSSITSDGKPNESYYRQRYDKLQQTMRDAERRVQLYENRVRSLNEMINNPNRDRFANAQLEQDRNDADDNLKAARSAYQKAQENLKSLQDEARRAGVSPGVFR